VDVSLVVLYPYMVLFPIRETCSSCVCSGTHLQHQYVVTTSRFVFAGLSRAGSANQRRELHEDAVLSRLLVAVSLDKHVSVVP
jgi:hypothetical protein